MQLNSRPVNLWTLVMGTRRYVTIITYSQPNVYRMVCIRVSQPSLRVTNKNTNLMNIEIFHHITKMSSLVVNKDK